MKVVSVCMNEEVKKTIRDIAFKKQISESKIINDILAKNLNLNEYQPIETRGRKQKALEPDKLAEYILEFRRKIEKKLYTCLFKDSEYYRLHLDKILLYIQSKKEKAKNFIELKDELKWLEDVEMAIITKNYQEISKLITAYQYADKEFIKLAYIKKLALQQTRLILSVFSNENNKYNDNVCRNIIKFIEKFSEKEFNTILALKNQTCDNK